jgi:hypothetical protein
MISRVWASTRRNPLLAAAIDAVAASALYALIAWQFLWPPRSAHWLEIVFVGVGFFIVDLVRIRRAPGTHSGDKRPPILR